MKRQGCSPLGCDGGLAKGARNIFLALAAAKASSDKDRLQRHPPVALRRATGPRATDREIDRLVYGLYGLTDDEIAIVEAGGSCLRAHGVKE